MIADMRENYQLLCNISITKSKDYKLVASINISCNKIRIKIIILYTRGNFLWIPQQAHGINSKQPKYFGDMPRSLNL
jgi:hypothetical protein